MGKIHYCHHCGTPFRPTRALMAYCKVECRTTHQLENRRIRQRKDYRLQKHAQEGVEV